jgi:hypothetical protein
MFENLLANYPKRTDLLHMYASQLIKAKEPVTDVRFVISCNNGRNVQLIKWVGHQGSAENGHLLHLAHDVVLWNPFVFFLVVLMHSACLFSENCLNASFI